MLYGMLGGTWQRLLDQFDKGEQTFCKRLRLMPVLSKMSSDLCARILCERALGAVLEIYAEQ